MNKKRRSALGPPRPTALTAKRGLLAKVASCGGAKPERGRSHSKKYTTDMAFLQTK